MWIYKKTLQFPVKIKKADANLAKVIITQFGGPDGELGASQRYLSQRYSSPYRDVAGILTDVGTEELAQICYLIRKSPNRGDFWVDRNIKIECVNIFSCGCPSVDNMVNDL